MLSLVLCQVATALTITNGQALEAGRRLWQNECGGRIDGLTSWNKGEDFASLGIGHFIWYPAGRRGPFEESFPRLLEYLSKNGVVLPAWLRGEVPCMVEPRELRGRLPERASHRAAGVAGANGGGTGTVCRPAA